MTTEETTLESGKTFTQEEVDNIVKDRLARERKKYNNINNGMSPNEADYQDRMNELEKKEREFEARKLLHEKGLPESALNLINLTDKESMEKSIQALEEVSKQNKEKWVHEFLRGGKPLKDVPPESKSLDEDTRAAFGL